MARGTIVDVAGARMGGAARFLSELDAYLARRPSGASAGLVIGRERELSPTWLVQRELQSRGRDLKIALNNVSFVGGGGRVVLLRNALHFADANELAGLGFHPPRSLNAQSHVVRGAARAADVVVVPCSAMAERVTRFVPQLERRLVVRPHPVRVTDESLSRGTASPPVILIPILPAPYKRLDWHVRRLHEALAEVGTPNSVIAVTASPDEMPAVSALSGIRFLGRLSAADLSGHWASARAVYFPTGLESFGYPLAEARVRGIPIIAQDSAQNREIAGAALNAFDPRFEESLQAAVSGALADRPEPDPTPFDPDRYFDWLFAGAQ